MQKIFTVSFSLYCLSFILLGAAIVSLGPLIPYLSAITHQSQTSYSFLFLCRSVGMVLGSFLLNLLHTKMSYHSLQLFIALFSTPSLIVFTVMLDQSMIQGLAILVSSAMLIMIDMGINICIIETYEGDKLEKKILIAHGMFGIGGLLGPSLVYLFEEKTMGVIGVMILLIAPFYLLIQSPENAKHPQQIIQNRKNEYKIIGKSNLTIQNNAQTVKVPLLSLEPDKNSLLIPKNAKYKRGSSFLRTSINILLNQRKHIQNQPPTKSPSDYSIHLISGCMFLYVGMQIIYGGWVSSYAVISKVNNKSEATRYSSLYWMAITGFRFCLAFIGGTVSSKLKILSASAVVVSFVSIVLSQYFQLVEFALYFSSIALGLSYSSIFPLLFTLPSQFNLTLTPAQTTQICQCSSLAEGVLSMLAGFLMDINIGMFYWTLFIAAIALTLLIVKSERSLHSKQQGQHLIELTIVQRTC